MMKTDHIVMLCFIVLQVGMWVGALLVFKGYKRPTIIVQEAHESIGGTGYMLKWEKREYRIDMNGISYPYFYRSIEENGLTNPCNAEYARFIIVPSTTFDSEFALYKYNNESSKYEFVKGRCTLAYLRHVARIRGEIE